MRTPSLWSSVAFVFCFAPLFAVAQFPSRFGGCPSVNGIPRESRGAFPSADALRQSPPVRDGLARAAAQAEQWRLKQNTPGMSLSVVYNGEVILERGLGLANETGGASVPVTPETVWRLGSISKVFVVLTLMEMRDRGMLSLDDTVVSHVPAFSFRAPKGRPGWGSAAYPADSRGITFRQLATHLSGLPSNNPYSFPHNISNDEALRMLSNMTLVLPADTQPLYSNLGFGMTPDAPSLSSVVGNRSDTSHPPSHPIPPSRSWKLPCSSLQQGSAEACFFPRGGSRTCDWPDGTEEHLGGLVGGDEVRLRCPLPCQGVADSFVLGFLVIRAAVHRKRVAEPYLSDGAPCGEACLSDWGWEDPPGSFFSSSRDMSTLLIRFLEGSPIWPQREESRARVVPNPSVSREMMLPRYMNADRISGFALPFELYWVGNYLIRTKRGDDNGWSAEMVLVPELKLGIITNVNVVENSADATQQVVNTLLPIIEAAIRTHQAPPSRPKAWEDYVGTYRHGESTVTVTHDRVSGQLYIATNFGVQMAQLEWNEGTDAFQLMAMEGDQWSCFLTEVEQSMFEWAEFSRSQAGSVEAVVLPAVSGYSVLYRRE
jgi:Beta-lactamase